MKNRVYICFNENDRWLTDKIRNSWLTKQKSTLDGFSDTLEFDSIKRQGDDSVKRWIDKKLEGTSVSIVIVDEPKAEPTWLLYEIKKSVERGNGLIFIGAGKKGPKDLENIEALKGIDAKQYQFYDWERDNGTDNLDIWIEASVLIAGRKELGPPPYKRNGKVGFERR
jgi:MTH538 TIR-like domain (DUF1863).